MNQELAGELGLEPVRKSIAVAVAPEAAFRVFTEGIGTWWPLASHSVGEKKAETCAFEQRAGGRIYERMFDGTEALWGTVLACESPRRLLFTWHPGRDPATAQEVEVRFEASGRGTRVELEHRGWEPLGEQAGVHRRRYVTGWDFVFVECYGRSAALAAGD